MTLSDHSGWRPLNTNLDRWYENASNITLLDSVKNSRLQHADLADGLNERGLTGESQSHHQKVL